jgi:hypothetical protein
LQNLTLAENPIRPLEWDAKVNPCLLSFQTRCHKTTSVRKMTQEGNGPGAGRANRMPKPAAHTWQFQTRFRKGAFGWRGSRTAIERIRQAVAEIRKAARADPILAAEGAIAFLRRVSPALEHIDSSSGAIGSAVNAAIDPLVAIISTAPADESTRRAWLEQLWQAFIDDQVSYIELLGDRWGELCAGPGIAAEWAERLMPPLLESFARDRTSRGYFHGTMAAFSTMLAAGRYQEILDANERVRTQFWGNRRWGFRALVAQGKRAEALRYAEASRSKAGNGDIDIALVCEELLLASGMAEEAYNRYAMAASAYEPTYLARFRALAKKYAWKAPSELLRDLVATMPGNEGKWFAAAKSAGLYDEAIALAQAAPCDPKTLSRAARDFVIRKPEFAMDAALAALRWLSEGHGYEITSYDVIEAYRQGFRAAEELHRSDEFKRRAIAVIAAGNSFVRDSLRSVLGESQK